MAKLQACPKGTERMYGKDCKKRSRFIEFAFYLFPIALAIVSFIYGNVLMGFVFFALIFATLLFDLKLIDIISIGPAIAGVIWAIVDKNAILISANVLFAGFIIYRLIGKTITGVSLGKVVSKASPVGVIVKSAKKIKKTSTSIGFSKWVLSPTLIFVALGIWYLSSVVVRSIIPSTILFILSEATILYAIFILFKRKK